MASSKPPKAGGGSRLARSEVTTVRLDPKLKYLAELAARKQRRTLSSFIEWAIEEALREFPIKEGQDWSTPFMDRAEDLWDVDEADRFAKLALLAPELLTHDEQLIWKLVKENGYLWRGSYANGTWTWIVAPDKLNYARLREHYEEFKNVALNGLSKSILPTWQDRPPPPAQSPQPPTGSKPAGFDDMDSDIPF